MPIRPEMKSRYPADWGKIRARILKRAGDRCEWCGVRNGIAGWRRADGTFVPLDQPPIRPEDSKVITIVLTIAHIHDRSPENCDDGNLAALCQKCHLDHDRDQHEQSRLAREREEQIAAGQLFLFEQAQ